MKLKCNQSRSITCGAVAVVEEQDGIHFFRFTEEQMALYRDQHPEHERKLYSTAGIRLRFRTNSRNLFLHAHMTDQGGSRRYFSIEFFKNGKRSDIIHFF